MKSTRAFKQKLSEILRLWEDKEFDRAFGEVEDLLTSWPGNAHLYILWAKLVQLQENPIRGLDEAKKALQHAIDLNKQSPAAAIELGYFLDNVEDNPQAASRAFSEATVSARRLLIDGLLGQAKAFLQLQRRDEAARCLREALNLAEVDSSMEKGKDASPDNLLRGPFASRLEELLKEVFLNRSA